MSQRRKKRSGFLRPWGVTLPAKDAENPSNTRAELRKICEDGSIGSALSLDLAAKLLTIQKYGATGDGIENEEQIAAIAATMPEPEFGQASKHWAGLLAAGTPEAIAHIQSAGFSLKPNTGTAGNTVKGRFDYNTDTVVDRDTFSEPSCFGFWNP